MCIPVYVKMDAKDQLLLSEGVWNQLCIITSHSAVNDKSSRCPRPTLPISYCSFCESEIAANNQDSPFQSTNVTIQFDKNTVPPQSFVIELLEYELDVGLYVGNSLVQTTYDDKAQVVITNLSPNRYPRDASSVGAMKLVSSHKKK